MKYYKIEMSNGYCGCNEVELVAVSDDTDIEDYAEDCLINDYYYYDPDSRFIGNIEDYDTEDEYYEECEAYRDELSVDFEELTYERYLKECENYGIIPNKK